MAAWIRDGVKEIIVEMVVMLGRSPAVPFLLISPEMYPRDPHLPTEVARLRSASPATETGRDWPVVLRRE